MIVPMMLAAAAPVEAPLWEMVPPVEAAEPCPLPAASWGKRDSSNGNRHWIISVMFEDGKLTWEEQPVDEATLRTRARAVRGDKSNPAIYFYSTGDCAEARRLAAIVAIEANCTPASCIASEWPVRTVLVPAPPPTAMPALPPAPPAPPAPSAETPVYSKRVAPRNSPQDWVINDDYPPEALRAGQQGTTTFRLDIDATGRVTDCTVTGSSGSPVLDETTCTLLKRRALFDPAEDAQGVKVAASWSSRFRWELPEEVPMARLSWTNIIQFTIGEDGAISGCTDLQFGDSGLPKHDACESWGGMSAEDRAQVRGKSVGPVTIIYRYEHSVSGVPMPRAPQTTARFRPIATMRITLEVDAAGKVGKCSGVVNPTPPAGAPSPCEGSEDSAYAAGPRPSVVTITRSMLTTGDTDVLPKPRAESE